VTFLFTDIAGSTQLWEQHRAAMQTALVRHDILLRRAIHSHHGAVVKTVGDSVYAAFVRAPDALAAALTAQRALHQEAWELPSPLRVRMALHTGVAEPRDGDYFGPPLNRLARLLTLGHGGQILLSRATHDLVVDDLPPETSLRALGDYQLKELARPEPIFQLVSAELPADFPPLRTTEVATRGERKPAAPLLATKLYAPRARPTLLLRPRLLARLDASLAGGRCTLLSAPAGAGKTSLLASWLANVGCPVAWLSLDERDQDAHQVLRYLIAAFQTVAPDCGRAALAWLDAPSPPPPETILTALINDLAAVPGPWLLVLDDYHLVRAPDVYAAVAFLLDHLPPALHLVLATREDPALPLARMRTRGQLTEVRAADLRFRPEEAAEFLEAGMRLQLEEGQVAALVARTEGWAAGLQLAALALRDRADPAAFVATFAGSHRLVADYLTAEVIDSQPAPRRRFLLASSLLHRLCAPLCDALLGVTKDERPTTKEDSDQSFVLRPSSLVGDSDSQAVLEELDRTNLFLVPLDDERRWYRYHHLFADALRARLRREIGQTGINDLYQRARLWHEQHDLPEEAMTYALAGRDWAAANKIMQQVSTSLWASSRHMLKWIEWLPEEEVDQSPELCTWYASWLMISGQFGRVDKLLQTAERVVRSSGQLSRLADVYGYRAMAGFLREDAQPTVENARLSIAYLGDENQYLRPAVAELLARGYFLKGELAEAERLWTETIALAHATGNQRTLLIIRAGQAELQRARGKLRQSAQLELELLQDIGERPVDIHKITALGRLASLYYEWDQLDQAEQYARQALELAGQTQREIFARSAHLTLARISWARGEDGRAFEVIERAKEFAQRLGGEHSMVDVSAGQVRLWLAQNARSSGSGQIQSTSSPAGVAGQSLSAAIDWAEAQRLDLDGELPYAGQITHLALCRVWIAQHRPDQAIRLLERLLAAAEAAGRLGDMVELLGLKALAHQAHYQPDQALAALTQALLLAEPQGYVRTFVDEGLPMAALLAQSIALRQAQEPRRAQDDPIRVYSERLLSAFPVEQRAASLSVLDAPPVLRSALERSIAVVEPLSKRELEVLQLLAQGLSNTEIAEQIYVSPQTVKVHTRNIYGKLGVDNRLRAVTKAKSLGLLA
jgi:LuxR family maltose regulon positive regulatory protein